MIASFPNGGRTVSALCYGENKMTAVAWTAIALLGATLAAPMGAIFQLDARIDAHLERRAG